MPLKCSEEEIEGQILSKLWRRKLFGGRYQPKEQVMSSIPKRLRSIAEDMMDKLRKEGLILYHKGGSCVSLNPRAREDIEERLKGVLPDYYFN